MNDTGNSTKGMSTQKMVLLLGSLVILATTIITIVILTRPKPQAQLPVSNTENNLVVNESNVAEIQENFNKTISSGMVETDMNTTWTFPDGKSASTDAVMGNSGNNQNAFWFEVILNETNEVVYTSSLLPVGSSVKDIFLSKNLEKGTYNADVRIHLVDEDNNPLDSNLGFNVTLVISQTNLA
jgi:hypothetical protein